MQQGYENDRPSTRLRATARTILNYVNAQKGGIQFELTSKKHNVHPSIIYPRPCNKCGSLYHNNRDCIYKQICIKCTSQEHTLKECKQKPKCINCGGAHEAYSELCDKLVEKTLAINKYTTEILVGEGIIARNVDILRTQRPYDEDCQQDINHKSITELIEKITEAKLGYVQQDINHIKNYLNKHDNEILNINKNINKITTDLELVRTDMSALKSNTDKIQGDMTNMITNMNSMNDKMNSNQNEIMHLLRNSLVNH